MKITKLKNQIIIENPTDFNIVHILDCGQIFRYEIKGNIAKVFSQNKVAVISTEPDKVVIKSTEIDYFYNFFDLDNNYQAIKTELYKYDNLKSAIDFGYGIRILKNDLFEMIVSFIISANNNIKRIKRSIQFLCEKFGTNMGDYFAFPSLKQLKLAKVEDFTQAGLGYRANYLFDTIKNLNEQQLHNLQTMPFSTQREFLLSLKGVGEKVVNCILLFGLGRKNVFPVDTWINKVFVDMFDIKTNNRKNMTQILQQKFNNLSGYAQQYLFYYYRENVK